MKVLFGAMCGYSTIFRRTARVLSIACIVLFVVVISDRPADLPSPVNLAVIPTLTWGLLTDELCETGAAPMVPSDPPWPPLDYLKIFSDAEIEAFLSKVLVGSRCDYDSCFHICQVTILSKLL